MFAYEHESKYFTSPLASNSNNFPLNFGRVLGKLSSRPQSCVIDPNHPRSSASSVLFIAPVTQYPTFKTDALVGQKKHYWNISNKLRDHSTMFDL